MDILRPVMEADLLVLDDLGAEKTSEWVEETMNLVVNTRYNERRPTIFTSNYEDSARRGRRSAVAQSASGIPHSLTAARNVRVPRVRRCRLSAPAAQRWDGRPARPLAAAPKRTCRPCRRKAARRSRLSCAIAMPVNSSGKAERQEAREFGIRRAECGVEIPGCECRPQLQFRSSVLRVCNLRTSTFRTPGFIPHSESELRNRAVSSSLASTFTFLFAGRSAGTATSIEGSSRRDSRRVISMRWNARSGRRGDGSPADTIFFGGGTPSLLEPAEVGRLIPRVPRAFDWRRRRGHARDESRDRDG